MQYSGVKVSQSRVGTAAYSALKWRGFCKKTESRGGMLGMWLRTIANHRRTTRNDGKP